MGSSADCCKLIFIGMFLIAVGEPHKVLIVPLIGKSHVFAMTAIGEELTRRGHQVTIILPENFPVSKDLASNGTGITVERYLFADGESKVSYEETMTNMTKLFLEKKIGILEMMRSSRSLTEAECSRLVVHNDAMMDKLAKVGFDIALVDSNFMMKYTYLLPHRLGVPWISYADMLDPLMARVPMLPSFVPHQLLTFTDRMSFVERLVNTVVSVAVSVVLPFPDPAEEILDKYRRYGSFDSLNELMSRSLLWLVPRDVVLDYPKPSMPNMVEIGGLTAKPAEGILPAELEAFMADAKGGVILVTFGSTVSTLPILVAEKFLSTFEQLQDFKIIWRFVNAGHKLTVPKNVLVAQWLPQNDILADPRVKLFITHCGNNGQYEAIYHGVPMIGFPLTGDQPYNAARLMVKGYGIAMELFTFTADELLSNVRQIIGDKSFRERTMLASKIFKSRPETPSERAANWIEHVIQFGGEHLRSGGMDLSAYQFYLLDVLAFVLLFIIVMVAVTVMLGKVLIRNCVGRTRVTTEKKAG